MECFAKRYCDCQGENNIFENSDTCYVLSFAIIMLNTSLHNPSVKDKPTIEQFINMNRGINQGQDLPRELLVVSVYASIVLRTNRKLHSKLYEVIKESTFVSWLLIINIFDHAVRFRTF
jgi:Sec7-like guanine-nucleotide exchange factor